MAHVAFLLAEDFEDTEFKASYDRILHAGHEVTVVGTEKGKELRGKKGKETFVTEEAASEVRAADYDAVVIPGGYSPDHLRMDPAVCAFTTEAVASGMPVAAICHGPSLLIETARLNGRNVTSWPSIRTDLRNAGANWSDMEVCTDENLITSRNPDDVPAFADAVVAMLESD